MLDCRAIDWLALLITDCNRPALLTDGVSCLALSEPLAGFAESPETHGPLEHVIGRQNADRMARAMEELGAGSTNECRIDSSCGQHSIMVVLQKFPGNLVSGMAISGMFPEKSGGTQFPMPHEPPTPRFALSCSGETGVPLRCHRLHDLSLRMLQRAETLARLASVYIDFAEQEVCLSPNLPLLLGLDPTRRIDGIEELFSAFCGADSRRLRERAQLAFEAPADWPRDRIDAQLPHRDGRVEHFEIAFHIDRNDRGEPVGLQVIFHEMTEQRLAEAGIRQLAFFDQLTSLANRTRFAAVLDETIAARAVGNRSLAVALLDLDGFKSVNDIHGHQMGDKVLQIFARRLTGTLKQQDLPARIGGDEFGVVLSSCETVEEARATCQRVVDRMAEPFVIDGTTLDAGVSVGYAIAPAATSTADELLANADRALYACKRNGKGRTIGAHELDLIGDEPGLA
ncbi:MAG: GGDEF domain-containing protein [Geminicoccaceae bacterium]|nr:GGDEF domain-containing protein [Geminicoccaceae bacterium]